MLVADGQTDPRKHNENIENLINSRSTASSSSSATPSSSRLSSPQANKAGIPVVTTSVGATTEGALTEVGGDESLMAEMMNRALLSAINYQGDMYVVWVPGAPLLETRKRVLEAMVQDYPKVKLHEVPTEHSPAKVQSQLESILTANPKPGSIAAVWGAYDLLVSGAVAGDPTGEAATRSSRPRSTATALASRCCSRKIARSSPPSCKTCRGLANWRRETVLSALKGKKDFPKTIFTNCWVATRHNVVEAAEMRWGKSVWDDLQMAKDDVVKRLPQDEQVLVVRPTLP